MLEKGSDSYSVHDYSKTGEHVAVSRKERYLPVHTIAPMEVAHELILGADLAGSKEIDELLDAAIDTG